MKSLIILVLAVAAVLAGPSQLYHSHWNDFKLTHEKVYDNLEEESLRYEIFTQNMKKIEEHNKLFEAGLETYSLGVTQFADLTEQEFLEFLTLSGPNPFLDDSVDVFVAPDDFVPPEHLDYREKHAVNPVKNQGACGSCWAFSTVATLESIYFLKSGKLLSLSEQNLVDCSRDYGNYGCSGGFMETGFNYIKDHGIETEEDYPYSAKDGKCHYDPAKCAVHITGHTNVEKKSEKSLEAAIVEKGPIAIAVDATKWQLYVSGIFSTTGIYRLNHGVVAVGLGVEDGKEFYIVRNSWGPAWGEKGYIRVARNADNQVGISDMACFPNL